MSDIKQGFLILVIRDEGRDYLRFLWYGDPFSTKPNIIILCFLRVVFGVISSRFLLNTTIKYHLERYRNDAKNFVEKFLSDLYVDGSAFVFFILKKHAIFFGIQNKLSKKVVSNFVNGRQIPLNIIKRDGNINSSDPSNESNHTRKVLGINWDLKADTITFYFDELVNEAFSLPMTKRSILNIIAKMFDPLGFTSPITISFKMLFQTIRTNKFNLDDPLPSDLLKG